MTHSSLVNSVSQFQGTGTTLGKQQSNCHHSINPAIFSSVIPSTNQSGKQNPIFFSPCSFVIHNKVHFSNSEDHNSLCPYATDSLSEKQRCESNWFPLCSTTNEQVNKINILESLVEKADSDSLAQSTSQKHKKFSKDSKFESEISMLYPVFWDAFS